MERFGRCPSYCIHRMTAQGEDVLAWLDAAITRCEQAARAVGWDSIEAGEYLWDTKYLLLRRGSKSLATTEMAADLAVHIALHDPASVLRRCAADRKLIAAHPVTRDVIVVKPDGIHGFGCSVCHTEDLLTVGSGWCDSLLALAEGYGWTEGER